MIVAEDKNNTPKELRYRKKIHSEGIGYTNMLAMIFVTLKLCDIITWSWLWVLSPIWIPLVVLLLLLVTKTIKKH